MGTDLIAHFSRLGSKCTELEAEEKLRIFHDFYRTGEETAFRFDMSQTMRKGHDFKDFICPDTFEFEKDYFRMGDRYGRVIFLREYAAYIKDSMVAELCELNRNMMLSVDVIPVPTDEAVREVENRLLGVETNITNWQRKQNQNNNFSAVIPYDLEQQRKESKEFLDDLTTRDQRMMFAVLTMVHTADTKERLDNDTEALLTTARKHLCQFAVLKYQQMDGLNTALPFGVRKIDALRTLTTESLAVFIPFRVQEIYHKDGVYYGQNVISKNMIIANRRHLLNGNSFILGVSGAGKSFTAKEEMTNIILTDPNADVIIIDPEREYSPLVKAMQGEVVHISATSENHINAICVAAAVLLFAAAVFCGFQVYHHYAQVDEQTEAFEQIAELVEQTPDTEGVPDDTPVSEGEDVLAKYKELYLQNEDMVGWISIAGTTVNYPVMQTPNDPNFYLKHNFEKAYSDLGVPYIQEDCDLAASDNLIIYGHHIKGQKMFGALESYKDKDFYEEHKSIQFDTLTEQAEYEIVAVFKTVAYSSEGFRYYDFVDAEDEKAFDEYVSKCKEFALYDTGVTAKYGDKLITLSTCEYSAQNGRLVVVAKKIA